MKIFVVLSFLLVSLSKSQTVELLTLKTSPTPNAVDLEWVGQSGKFYYLQCSADLEDWNFMGVVDAGDGSVISYGFPTNFTSLNYRVVIRLTPPTGDADGDGLTDEDEHFVHMTNADDADSDGDGVDDREEVVAGTDPWSDTDRPFYVLEVTWPSDVVVEYFLTKEFWVLKADEATDPDWWIGLSQVDVATTLDLQLKSFEPVDGVTTLNVLNFRDRESAGADQYTINNIALVIPSERTASPVEQAENNPLPELGGYAGKWGLYPVSVLELSPEVKDEEGNEIAGSEKIVQGRPLGFFVEIDPHANRIAHRELKVKIGGPLEDRKVIWSLDVLPGATPATVRGEWEDSPTHKDRFEVSAVYGISGFNRVSQTSGETTVAESGQTAIRVNVPPIGLNQVRIRIQIEGVAGELDLIDMEVPAVVVIDPGHGGIDSGAVGRTDNSVLEKDLALAYSLKLREELIDKFKDERHGFLVKMTREDDSTLKLSYRAPVARDLGADIFVSIHFNSALSSSARGSETYVERTPRNRNQAEDAGLASLLQNSVVSAIQAEDVGGKHRLTFNHNWVLKNNLPILGVKTAGFVVTKDGAFNNGNSTDFHPVRACLVEIEFISNDAALNAVKLSDLRGIRSKDGFSQSAAQDILNNIQDQE